MVSQLVFGERCAIIDRSGNHWLKIKSKYDGYEGWCQDSHLHTINQDQYDQPENALTRQWITEIDYDGRPMKLPLGSSLSTLKKGKAQWQNNLIQYKGKTWDPSKAKKNKKDIKQLAYKFLNTPYLWGGKTVFGADCSGYTQTVFKFFNIHLLRDAWQQAEQGELVNSLKESGFGDLAFFDNEEGRITHVGILLNNHKIIHASGKVRIDTIDESGIINEESAQRTHRLRVIKRFLTKK